MSRRIGSRGTRLVAAFAVLGVVVALAAGLRAASAATNNGSAQGKVQHATNGPKAADFIDIKKVKPNVKNQRAGRNGSAGTFVSDCGTNGNHHNNPDNHIVAPGAANGAHHMHDYVGNKTTNGKSNDKSLAK